MNLTGSRKRTGRKLKPAQIDDDKKVQDHERSQRMKTHVHRVTVVALYGALIGLPLLYGAWLVSSWHDQPEREKVITTGIGSLVSFLIGKAKFKLDD
ncbi:MAG TPA: hypothetical protein VJP80_06175 [Candidatus Saccharimonadales bacterium]|nr:hypothetical protein [Candidatus Saccharimonadales bacterium]